jgi:hypothetical protein
MSVAKSNKSPFVSLAWAMLLAALVNNFRNQQVGSTAASINSGHRRWVAC